MEHLHPSVRAILQYFDHRHLPAPLAAVSKRFALLAFDIAATASGPEATVALRKLLEAKDAAVRATKGDMSVAQLTELANSLNPPAT